VDEAKVGSICFQSPTIIGKRKRTAKKGKAVINSGS